MNNLNRRGWLSSAGGVAAAGLLAGQPAIAATRTTMAKPLDAMQVEAVQMPAWGVKDGQQIPLAPGDSLAGMQEVETASGAGLVLRVPEGSVIRLGEKTRLGVQRLEVDSALGTTTVKAQLKLYEGFFRFATSSVAKAVGARQVQVSLRTATVGIRGTDFWSMTDPVHDAVCLFEGNVGLQTQEQGELSLDKPTAFWARFFEKPVSPVGNATPDQLNTFLASTELKPGKGIAVAGGQWRVIALATLNSKTALTLAGQLRSQGFPAQMRRLRNAERIHEVAIGQLATRGDAEVLLARIAQVAGVSGRIEHASV